MMFNIPGQSVTKKRNTYASLFDRFSASGDTEITEEQKASLFRKGLLNFAINSLGTKGQGFGGAAAAGLSGGLLAMDEGAQQIGNDRYKNEILARTRQGMERNTQMEQLAKQYMGADGQFDHEGYANALAQYDPQASLEYKSKLQPPGRKNPGQPVYFPDPSNPAYEVPYVWDDQGGGYVPAGQFLGQGGPQVAAQPQRGGAGFDSLVGGLLKREGGYVADDAGKGATNFGINSAANPDVDVRNLTPEKAMELYRQRYWLPIGGDNLPPAIQSAALDAAVNQGPERAKQWIAMAGNDPRKFAELRQAHYDGLVASNPQKYGQYADSWRNRNMETAGIAPPRQSQVPPGAFGRRPVKGKGAEKAPAGYRYTMDGNMEPIPGGPAQMAIEAKQRAAEAKQAAAEAKDNATKVAGNARQAASVESANDLITSIDELFAHPGFSGLGTMVGDAQIWSPIRNDVKDANSSLRSIAGRIALTTMDKLRAMSSQGATGFGALSAGELKLLENSIAALQNEDISNKQLVANLKTVKEKMKKITEWQPQGAAPPPANDDDDLIGKYLD